jgi:hypothetical protein
MSDLVCQHPFQVAASHIFQSPGFLWHPNQLFVGIVAKNRVPTDHGERMVEVARAVEGVDAQSTNL